jgi:hypothetical protein
MSGPAPALRTTSRRPWIALVALAVLVAWPAAGSAQTPAVPGTTAPPTQTAPAPAAAAPDRPDPGQVVAATVSDPLELLQQPGDEVKLSDEKRTTRWAHPQATAAIHLSPQTSSRVVARLHYLTEDGVAEVYPALAARMDSAGRRWVRLRVPKRPNGKIGWVLDETIGSLYVVRTRLVINRSTLRAQLYKRGTIIWSAPVGVGKASTPTPRGQFWIRERLKSLGGGSLYGPWAFGTSAYSILSDWPGGGVVGIHGTNEPQLIPGRPSHGCVRVRNDAIRVLARLMPIGTPVQITG